MPPPSALQSVDPDREIDKVLKGLSCARVASQYALRAGDVELSGHVKSEADIQSLLARLTSIPGVEKVGTSGLYVVGEPYCNVLTLLTRADLVRSTEQRQDFTAIGNVAQSGVLRLTKGMPIELELKTPNFSAFVYVDYFSSDGKVYHLLPGRDYGKEAFAAGSRFGIGRPSDPGPRIRVAAPFGLDMIVALGSSVRLFDQERPASEDAGVYLAAIGSAIDRMKRDDGRLMLEYAYHLIFTSDAPTP